MAHATDSTTLVGLAEGILGQVSTLDKYMKESFITEPSLAAGASTELWSLHSGPVEDARSSIFGLTKQLNKLLEGPHGFLHGCISSNWELGALYTVLEFDILEKIPLAGQAHLSELASQSNLPVNKLLSILRLISCEQILEEVSDKTFRHTAISEELVHDPNLKAFLGFQLFETRIASAHLADTLKQKANEYQNGQSAFKYAWGKSLYDWHKLHPEKSARFGKAMQGVTQTLDPGNALFHDWFSNHQKPARNLVIETHAKNAQTSLFLAEAFPVLAFQVQLPPPSLLPSPQTLPPAIQQRISFQHHDPSILQQPTSNSDLTLAYVIRNVLWNCSDDEVVEVLRGFLPVLERDPAAVLLINEMLSPAPGMFKPHVEEAYRRRDVTTMTMHNAKQRTEDEWRGLFALASPHLEANVTTAYSSHSFRGLWEVRWVPAN